MYIIPKKTLITVCVIYWRPTYTHLLQEFIWQTDDSVPELPRIHKFLRFWKDEIEAIIQSVEIAESNSSFRTLDLEKIFQRL